MQSIIAPFYIALTNHIDDWNAALNAFNVTALYRQQSNFKQDNSDQVELDKSHPELMIHGCIIPSILQIPVDGSSISLAVTMLYLMQENC